MPEHPVSLAAHVRQAVLEALQPLAQLTGAGVEQDPPLQVLCPRAPADEQLGPGLQELVGYTHAPSLRLPQAPPQVVPAPAHEPREPWGATDATGEQVPCFPATSQAMHDAVQA